MKPLCINCGERLSWRGHLVCFVCKNAKDRQAGRIFQSGKGSSNTYFKKSGKITVSRPIIYFIASDEAQRFKIGVTSDLERRLMQMRIDSPTPLYIYGFFDVFYPRRGFEIEKALHLEFMSHHSHGEWFHLNGSTKWMISYAVKRGNAILPEEEALENIGL
jgi:hypothetical protein